jgi:hypothetical protein
MLPLGEKSLEPKLRPSTAMLARPLDGTFVPTAETTGASKEKPLKTVPVSAPTVMLTPKEAPTPGESEQSTRVAVTQESVAQSNAATAPLAVKSAFAKFKPKTVMERPPDVARFISAREVTGESNEYTVIPVPTTPATVNTKIGSTPPPPKIAQLADVAELHLDVEQTCVPMATLLVKSALAKERPETVRDEIPDNGMFDPTKETTAASKVNNDIEVPILLPTLMANTTEGRDNAAARHCTDEWVVQEVVEHAPDRTPEVELKSYSPNIIPDIVKLVPPDRAALRPICDKTGPSNDRITFEVPTAEPTKILV